MSIKSTTCSGCFENKVGTVAIDWRSCWRHCAFILAEVERSVLNKAAWTCVIIDLLGAMHKPGEYCVCPSRPPRTLGIFQNAQADHQARQALFRHSWVAPRPWISGPEYPPKFQEGQPPRTLCRLFLNLKRCQTRPEDSGLVIPLLSG